MTTPRRTSVLCLALTVALAAAPTAPAAAAEPPAPPQSPAPDGGAAVKPTGRVRDALSGDARAAFDRAAELFLDGNFAAARVEYERAHALSKEPRVLYNVATCEKALRHYTRAIAALEASLAEGGDRLPSAYRSLATETLGVLRPFVTTLTLAVDPLDATLTLDGEHLEPKAASAPLPVDVGEHVIVATKPGFVEGTVKVTAVSGAPARAALALLPLVARDGLLRVVTDGPTSVISLDDARVGTGEFSGRVRAGEHRLEVTRSGFYPYQAEVVVREGETRRIPVSLTRKVPVWVWIVGSIVVAGGATVGIVVGTAKTQFNGSTPGTLPPMVVTAGFRNGGISW
jgi:hypothetical protein